MGLCPKPRDLPLWPNPGPLRARTALPSVGPVFGPARRSGCVPALPYPPSGTEQLITTQA